MYDKIPYRPIVMLSSIAGLIMDGCLLACLNMPVVLK